MDVVAALYALHETVVSLHREMNTQEDFEDTHAQAHEFARGVCAHIN